MTEQRASWHSIVDIEGGSKNEEHKRGNRRRANQIPKNNVFV